jgi:hypothetical protein
MTTIRTLSDAVRDAWASIPAPPAEDLKYMAWGWGEEAAREFTGVAPMDVDVRPFLPPKCRKVLAHVATFIASEHEAFASLTPEAVATMRAQAAKL